MMAKTQKRIPKAKSGPQMPACDHGCGILALWRASNRHVTHDIKIAAPKGSSNLSLFMRGWSVVERSGSVKAHVMIAHAVNPIAATQY